MHFSVQKQSNKPSFSFYYHETKFVKTVLSNLEELSRQSFSKIIPKSCLKKKKNPKSKTSKSLYYAPTLILLFPHQLATSNWPALTPVSLEPATPPHFLKRTQHPFHIFLHRKGRYNNNDAAVSVATSFLKTSQ